MIKKEVIEYIGTLGVDELKNLSDTVFDRIKLLRNRECLKVAIELIPDVTRVKLKNSECKNKTSYLYGKVAVVKKVNTKTVSIEFGKDIEEFKSRNWNVPASLLEIV